MPPFLITVNLALYQILEHIDSDGWYGNLLDMLPVVMTEPVDAQGMVSSLQGIVKTNRPLPCFIMPPGDRARFKSFMRRLSNQPIAQGTLGDLQPREWQIIS